MEIQRCEKCGTKFKYMDVLESIGWVNKSLECNNCGTKHNFKMYHMLIIPALLIGPIFFINQMSQFPLNMLVKTTIALFYIIYIAVIVGLYPFIIRYRLEGEINKDSNHGIK